MMKKMLLVPLMAALVLPAAASAQTAGAPKTNAEKIANATAAAPASLASTATIMDWPASENAQPTVLRPGTGDWVCFPDHPLTPGNDPMCLDSAWRAFIEAHMTKATPSISRVGIAYMLAPGGASGSNTDPYATGPTPTNEWAHDGPHIMIVVPNPAALEGLPTKRESGGAYVMWRGTPYAHIMVPVTGGH